ncbi:MAG: hypothetical protein ABL982_03520 [Vicinamibacterales bacterium]
MTPPTREPEPTLSQRARLSERVKVFLFNAERFERDPDTHVAHLYRLIRDLQKDRLTLEGEVETLHLKLVACMAAALGNTEATVRLPTDHPYWSASYADVCRAVDREIEHRASHQRLREGLEQCAEQWEAEAREWVAEAKSCPESAAYAAYSEAAAGICLRHAHEIKSLLLTIPASAQLDDSAPRTTMRRSDQDRMSQP